MNWSDHEEFERVALKTTSFHICESDAMRQVNDSIGLLLDYCAKKAGAGRIVRGVDIDLLELSRFVPRICLLDFERDADGEVVDAMMRMQGSEIARQYKDVMGKSVREQNIEEVEERIFYLSNRISQTRKPIVALAKRLSEQKEYVSMSVLYVPLSDDNAIVNGALLYIETA
jgi:hypothetical protein